MAEGSGFERLVKSPAGLEDFWPRPLAAGEFSAADQAQSADPRRGAPAAAGLSVRDRRQYRTRGSQLGQHHARGATRAPGRQGSAVRPHQRHIGWGLVGLPMVIVAKTLVR